MDHLSALTADSPTLALAHTTLNGDGDHGLGLLSGSRLSDIITTLAVTVFGATSRYEKGRWLAFLQTAVPGCTEHDPQWLIFLPAPVDSPLPAPQSQGKREASVICGSDSVGHSQQLEETLSRHPKRARSPLPPLSPDSDGRTCQCSDSGGGGPITLGCFSPEPSS